MCRIKECEDDPVGVPQNCYRDGSIAAIDRTSDEDGR
jgi:hypothetical protein